MLLRVDRATPRSNAILFDLLRCARNHGAPAPEVRGVYVGLRERGKWISGASVCGVLWGILRDVRPRRAAARFRFAIREAPKSICLNEKGRLPRAYAFGQVDLKAKLSLQRYAVKDYFPVRAVRGKDWFLVLALELEQDPRLSRDRPRSFRCRAACPAGRSPRPADLSMSFLPFARRPWPPSPDSVLVPTNVMIL